ncbi:MAG: hypothetical protein K0S76_1798 [Herbinix sp.]|jgi:hypothetical protein|nr:hypothetical protein [Herbinix sp.]
MIFKYSYAYKHSNPFAEHEPVDVIVNFAKDGRFIPIYFRIVAQDSQEYNFKIDGVKYTKDKHECIIFCCLFTNEGVQHEITLSFFYKECLWRL